MTSLRPCPSGSTSICPTMGYHPSQAQLKVAERGTWIIPADHPTLVGNTHLAALAQSAFQVHHTSLRADSAGAPETVWEAWGRGGAWIKAVDKEYNNHKGNKTWTELPLSDLPKGRRLHKFVWVFKEKRDGTCKGRLAIQGCTMKAGVDYDQVKSTALRYGSARCIFAYAARMMCGIRSWDLVAAYLQGDLNEGEHVYCYPPPGYEPKSGEPKFMCRIDKPVYGMPASGRCLQRKLMAFMKRYLIQLDDSDDCVLVLPPEAGYGDETFAVGVYVDNLQIVHSAKLNPDGTAVDENSFYHKFVTELQEKWDVVDEGDMDDLLGMQVRRNKDKSITLHQQACIEKMVERFYPKGLPKGIGDGVLPYSSHLQEHMTEALAHEGSHQYPELVKPYQERLRLHARVV